MNNKRKKKRNQTHKSQREISKVKISMIGNTLAKKNNKQKEKVRHWAFK
jgi:hypothetical protein